LGHTLLAHALASRVEHARLACWHARTERVYAITCVTVLSRGQTFDLAIPPVRGLELETSSPSSSRATRTIRLMILVPPKGAFATEHRLVSPSPATLDVVHPRCDRGVLLDDAPVAAVWHRVGTSAFSFAAVNARG